MRPCIATAIAGDGIAVVVVTKTGDVASSIVGVGHRAAKRSTRGGHQLRKGLVLGFRRCRCSYQENGG